MFSTVLFVFRQCDTSANHFLNAPVGGHTYITAGEQGEPADYE